MVAATTRFHQAVDSDELSGLAARHGEAGDAVFERCDALLEHVGGRVHDARVDVAEFLQGEQGRGMRGIFENERRGLIDGDGSRAGGRVRLIAVVE